VLESVVEKNSLKNEAKRNRRSSARAMATGEEWKRRAQATRAAKVSAARAIERGATSAR
jgi:hypothetical protein